MLKYSVSSVAVLVLLLSIGCTIPDGITFPGTSCRTTCIEENQGTGGHDVFVKVAVAKFHEADQQRLEETETEIGINITTARKNNSTTDRVYIAEVTEGPAGLIGEKYTFETRAEADSVVMLLVQEGDFEYSPGELDAISQWLDDHFVSPETYHAASGY